MSRYLLSLFVYGDMEETGLIQANLDRLFLEAQIPYQLQVIDIQEQPAASTEYRVLAFPTLLKIQPYPQARLIGNLTDAALVREALRLPGSLTIA
jgi:circadian clock protein KaiB